MSSVDEPVNASTLSQVPGKFDPLMPRSSGGRFACFTPHIFQDESFVAKLWELRQFDYFTVWAYPADDPSLFEGVVRIQLPDRPIE